MSADQAEASTSSTTGRSGAASADAERAKRLRLLAERLRNPDGLDHDALARVEPLSGNEQ